MRFRDRPLLVDGLDAALYLARPALEARLVGPLLEGRNVLLLGESGAGKSTLLRRAVALLDSEGRPAVMVNAALADDAPGLLGLVGAALQERLGDGDGDPAADRSGPAGSSLLSAARRLRRDEPVAILVDGLVDPTIGYDVFGRLRDELWELGHVWGVALRPRDSAALRTPPAGAFWGAVVEIGPLDEMEAEALLRLGLDEDEHRAVSSHLIAGETYPRTVIRTAQEVLAGGGATPARPWGQALLERASQLGRSEAMALAELQALGRPVSAHDTDLLERLGWTRPYAQRILSHLEETGLLRSIPERSDRPGRPRKLYEPNPSREPR